MCSVRESNKEVKMSHSDIEAHLKKQDEKIDNIFNLMEVTTDNWDSQRTPN